MMDEGRENEFHIIVDNERLEEVPFRDGNTYVTMPLFGPTGYSTEFEEEIRTHGAVEICRQHWPVYPYTVAVRNRSDKQTFATLYIDGQKIATKYISPSGSYVFEGVPTEAAIHELLFSLPRFSTLKEKESSGGRSMPASKVNELGTIKVVWNECIETGKSFRDGYQTFGASSFVQANKADANDTRVATAASQESAGITTGGTTFASTTRKGKVVKYLGTKSCTVTDYKFVGVPTSACLLYRTKEYLQGIGVLPQDRETPEEEERRQKRADNRRKRRRAEQAERACTNTPSVPVFEVSAVEEPSGTAETGNGEGGTATDEEDGEKRA